MMAYVEARHYTSASDIIASAKAVRDRLFRPLKAVIEMPEPRVRRTIIVPTTVGASDDAATRKNRRDSARARAKREALKAEMALMEPKQPSTIAGTIKHEIVQRCIAKRVSYFDVVGASRYKNIGNVRHEIMCEIYLHYMGKEDEVSFLDLCRAFNRDNKTYLYVIRKAGIYVSQKREIPACDRHIAASDFNTFKVQVSGFNSYRNVYFGSFKSIEDARRMRNIAVLIRDGGEMDSKVAVAMSRDIFKCGQVAS